MLLLGYVYSCDNKEKQNQETPDNGINADYEALKSFNSLTQNSTKSAHTYSSTILGAQGIFVQAQGLKDMDLSVPASHSAYIAQTDKLTAQMNEAHHAGLVLLWQLYEMNRIRSGFLLEQSQSFPLKPLTLSAKHRFLGTTFFATTALITVYGIYKSTSDAIKGSQRVVQETAASSESGRKAVLAALRDEGVENIADTATATEIAQIFDEQGYRLRGRVTTKVRSWNLGEIANGSEHSDEAVTVSQNDKEHIIEAANQLGKVAVEGVVAGEQMISGGVGDIIARVHGTETAKIAGAATDLLLSATGTDPMTVVSKKATITVVSKDTREVTIAPPTVMPEDEAINLIKSAQTNTQDVSAKQLDSATESLMLAFAQDNRLAIINNKVRAPARVALTELDLIQEPGSNAPTYSAKTKLAGFSATETADILISLPEHMPVERENYALGSSNPLAFSYVPLLGTIKLGVEFYDLAVTTKSFKLTADVKSVYSTTTLSLDVENGSTLNRVQTMPKDGSYTWVVYFEKLAHVRVVRHDTGESYSMSIPEPKTPHVIPEQPDTGDCPMLVGTYTYTQELTLNDTPRPTFVMTLTLNNSGGYHIHAISYVYDHSPEPVQSVSFEGTISGEQIPPNDAECAYDHKIVLSKAKASSEEAYKTIASLLLSSYSDELPKESYTALLGTQLYPEKLGLGPTGIIKFIRQ